MPKAKTKKEEGPKTNECREEAQDRDYEDEHGPDHRHGPECPLCAVMGVFGRRKRRHSDFFGHLRQAEAEVLKAFRSLIDDRLEECQEEAQPRKATKIKVT